MKKKLFRLTGILVLAVMLVSSFATVGLAKDCDDKEVYINTSANDAEFVKNYIPDYMAYKLKEQTVAQKTDDGEGAVIEPSIKGNFPNGGNVIRMASTGNFSYDTSRQWAKFTTRFVTSGSSVTEQLYFGTDTTLANAARSIKTPFVFACDIKLPENFDSTQKVALAVEKISANKLVSIPVFIGFGSDRVAIGPAYADLSNGVKAKFGTDITFRNLVGLNEGVSPWLSNKQYGYSLDGTKRIFARAYLYLDPYSGNGVAAIQPYLIDSEGNAFKNGHLDVKEFTIDENERLTKDNATNAINGDNYSIRVYTIGTGNTSMEIRNERIYIDNSLTIFDEKPVISETNGTVGASVEFYNFFFDNTKRTTSEVLIAVYNKETGELLNVNIENAAGIQRGNGHYAFGKGNVTSEINLTTLSDGTYDVKAFVWKSLSDIMPKTSSAVKTFKVETTDGVKTVTEFENN